jgi:hypothetical protein
MIEKIYLLYIFPPELHALMTDLFNLSLHSNELLLWLSGVMSQYERKLSFHGTRY